MHLAVLSRRPFSRFGLPHRTSRPIPPHHLCWRSASVVPGRPLHAANAGRTHASGAAYRSAHRYPCLPTILPYGKFSSMENTVLTQNPVKVNRIERLDALHSGTLLVAAYDRWGYGDNISRSTDGGTPWVSKRSGSMGHWRGSIAIDPFTPIQLSHARLQRGFGLPSCPCRAIRPLWRWRC